MNSVVLIGKLTDISEVVSNGKWQRCDGQIEVARPYKVKGEYKHDRFRMLGWGEYARRLNLAKRGQIIGITGMLEKDDEGKVYINVKGVTFYTNETAEALTSRHGADEELEEVAGFAAIAVSEIPDF